MIRWLLLFIGLACGTAVALALNARVSDLARVAPDAAPDLVAALAPEARITSGTTRPIELRRGLPPVTIHWEFLRISTDGPQFDTRISGDGLQLDGTTTIGWSMAEALLTIASGSIDAALLASGQAVTGMTEITGGVAVIRLREQALDRLSLDGRLHNATFDGVDLGEGSFAVTPGTVGAWLGWLEMAGGPALALRAELRGSYSGTAANAVVEITEGESMPGHWRRALDQFAEKKKGGWRLETPVPVLLP